MNQATALARLVVERLIGFGVRDVVLSPGSRSAPLALALAAAADSGSVRLVVRVDERSAAYLALGMARGRQGPVAVLCTSGTAVANLMPAVIEASYAGIPLICLTADRPPELRNVGANQTIDQVGLFGDHVRSMVDLGREVGDAISRVDVAELDCALRAAVDGSGAGPVQINVAFREPLVPDSPEDLLPGAGVGATTYAPAPGPAQAHQSVRPDPPDLVSVLELAGLDAIPARGLIVAGDILDPADSVAVSELARATGWPVFSEPSGNAAGGPQAVAHFPLLLAAGCAGGSAGGALIGSPELVITVGRFGLSRPTGALVRSSSGPSGVPSRRPVVHISVHLSGCDVPDPWRTAAAVIPRVPVVAPGSGSGARSTAGEWCAGWRSAAHLAAGQIEGILAQERWNGVAVAREVMASARPGDLVLVAASRSVRDVQDFASAPASGVRVIGNRGASGIDGLVSTAWGAAQASGRRTVALLGDLAFLHDCGGLAAAPGEPQPNLILVVGDNNGGGIFSSLEQGRPEFAGRFERIFGTPHDRDLCAVAESFGVEAIRVADRDALADQMTRREDGVRVIVADLPDRAAEEDLRVRIATAVAAALNPVDR